MFSVFSTCWLISRHHHGKRGHVNRAASQACEDKPCRSIITLCHRSERVRSPEVHLDVLARVLAPTAPRCISRGSRCAAT